MLKGVKVQHNRPLTPSQLSLLVFLYEYGEKNSRYPSMREIQREYGLLSHSAAQYYVKLLEVKGYILRFKGRIYKITDKYDKST